MSVRPTRPRRGLWYGLAAVVVVVTSLFSGLAVVTWLVEQHQSTTKVYAGDVRSVSVDAGSAAIRIFAGPAGTASVAQTLTWVNSKPMVRQDFDPSTGVLTISVLCDSPSKLLGADACSAQLDVQVPTATSVTSTSGGGALTVTGLSGSVDALTGSGEINLTSLSGPVKAQAGSGAISAGALQSATVTATADSGSVDLDFAGTPTQVTTAVTSGSIDVGLPHGTQYRVSASASSSGEATVDPGLDSHSAPGVITATATMGAIDIHYR